MDALGIQLSKKTTWVLNAVILLVFAAIAAFSRPWAAFAGFLFLGALIGMLRAAVRIRYQGLGGGSAAVALLTPPVAAGFAYAAVFLSMFFVGDFWQPVAVLVCAYVVYVSLLLPWRTPGR